jgi:Tol biopolymer transport system component
MITRLSAGSKHHFFGYYGICPLNLGNRYHLALETDFHDHAPTPEDSAGVGLVDCTNGSFERFAETRAFNLQQGSMMHWINAGSGEEFTYNDWEGDRLVSRAVNPHTRATRTINGAIAAVSGQGPVAIGLNFARMSACRHVVGYANSIYNAENILPIPDDDGLYRIDLKTGQSSLLVSIADIHGREPRSTAPHWFNHAVFNPQGSRVLFFCRIIRPGRFLTSVWVANTDGTGLDCLIGYDHDASHYAWQDDDSIMISTDVLGEMEFVSINVRTKEASRMEIAGFPADGHNAFSPDHRWLVCDTYPHGSDRKSRLLLHNRETKSTLQVGSFSHAEHIKGDWRCDLHPRWSADGTMVTFDSIHEGSRQIYAVAMPEVVRNEGNTNAQPDAAADADKPRH